MSQDLLLDSLRTAVAAAPDDLHLRLHLARLLAEAGERAEAVRQAAAVLQRDPGHEGALALIAGPAVPPSPILEAPPPGPSDLAPVDLDPTDLDPADLYPADLYPADLYPADLYRADLDPADLDPDRPVPGGTEPIDRGPIGRDLVDGVDGDVIDRAPGDPVPAPAHRLSDDELLRRLDSEFTGIVPPMFVGGDRVEDEGRIARYEYGYDDPDDADEPDDPDDPDFESDDDLVEMLTAFRPESSDLTLADVAGMDDVKARLEAAVLAPIRNPELVRLYAKSLRGGLLLYGPPGCGKTFVARALAGELGARLLSVSLADVLDVYVGQSERNIHAIFEIARRNSPCVIFLDEVDAIGQKRAQLRSSASRGTVNQLLTEMDGLAANNDGVYVLGATNHPWDVDVAFRRPGRFDRMVLVLPPDEQAREAVLRHHLRDRPIAGVDTARLARMTAGYSGADLAYVCESAAERALLDSVRTGRPRMIEMPDLEAAVNDSRPSIGPWLQTARNVAEFANADGSYDDLLAYLHARRPA